MLHVIRHRVRRRGGMVTEVKEIAACVLYIMYYALGKVILLDRATNNLAAVVWR